MEDDKLEQEIEKGKSLRLLRVELGTKKYNQEYNKAVQRTDEYRIKQEIYRKSEKRKDYMKEYRKTEKFKKYMNQYQQVKNMAIKELIKNHQIEYQELFQIFQASLKGEKNGQNT